MVCLNAKVHCVGVLLRILVFEKNLLSSECDKLRACPLGSTQLDVERCKQTNGDKLGA